METATKTSPHISPAYGASVITFWLDRIRIFLYHHGSKHGEDNGSKRLFDSIFTAEHGKHLFCKSWRTEFGGFFLNLDTKNQIALLNYLANGSNGISLTLPKIENWEELGKKYGLDQDGSEYTMDDVRMYAKFEMLTDWQIYPTDLVWLQKFVLYANNNRIPETLNYLGERHGNFENWLKYYNWLSAQEQLEIAYKLRKYE